MKTLIIFMICKFIFIADALESGYPVWPQDNTDSKYFELEVTYMAGLYELEELFCTGAFISEFHILTVASCIEKFFMNLLTSLDNYHAKRGKLLTPFEVSRYQFEKVEIHNGYNWNDWKLLQDNIGLITVTSINPSLKPQHILSEFQMSENDYSHHCVGHVIGWGNLQNSEPSEEKELYSAMFQISGFKSCQSIIKPRELDKIKMFCACKKWDSDSFSWDVNVDRGVPFIKGMHVIGILSFPPHGIDKKSTGVFMKLKEYKPWIEMAQLPEDKRTDQGRRFRIRESNGTECYESPQKQMRF